jgi:hypothetical protein
VRSSRKRRRLVDPHARVAAGPHPKAFNAAAWCRPCRQQAQAGLSAGSSSVFRGIPVSPTWVGPQVAHGRVEAQGGRQSHHGNQRVAAWHTNRPTTAVLYDLGIAQAKTEG